MRLEIARTIADAVMMEGYALYPYRATAPKNQFRWTFGLLAPRAWSESGGCEPWWLEAQILVAGTPTRIAGQLRFFQIERRRVDGSEVRWDEGIPQEIAFEVRAGDQTFTIEGSPGGERSALTGRIAIAIEVLSSTLSRLAIRIENTTPWSEPRAPRDRAIAAAFASTHLIVGVDGGELLSAIDPPAWAREHAARCRSVGVHPVLVGPPGSADVMLAAPFILYDHPQLAPESAGDLCDATEIDELLILRTRTLTDDEKRAARATDPRVADIIDRAEAIPPAWMARMHGAARELAGGEMVPRVTPPRCGSKVRLRPSTTRRTDAQDALYAGSIATVAAIRHDVDGSTFVAVTVDDDPAAELHDWYGRYQYYRLDELEPI